MAASGTPQEYRYAVWLTALFVVGTVVLFFVEGEGARQAREFLGQFTAIGVGYIFGGYRKDTSS